MNIEFQNILDVDEKLIELVRNWRNTKHVNQYMYTNHNISKEEHKKWIEKLRKKDSGIAWIIRYNGKSVGLAQLSNIDYENKITEWGYYIAEEAFQSKGIGTASLKKLIKYVFEEMDFLKMKTIVLENNSVAIKLYEKFGFKKKGELNEKLIREGKQISIIEMELSKDDLKKVK
jgi:UDP-4-amino-4,6-dideoxy-N-acetyl-beta-L-altrosamine N-acetyltransferase